MYYWEDGLLRRRSFEDPTNPVNLLPVRQPRSGLALDSQFVYFIYDNGRVMRWPKFTVWQDERYDEAQTHRPLQPQLRTSVTSEILRKPASLARPAYMLPTLESWCMYSS